MANYLILCSDYLSPSDANGICIRNVVNEFNSREDSVYIISESDRSGLIYSKNNIFVYGIDETKYLKEFIDSSYDNKSDIYKEKHTIEAWFMNFFERSE